MITSILESARKPWEELQRQGKLKDAIVVADEGAARSIAWIGGLGWMLSLGVKNVITVDSLLRHCDVSNREEASAHVLMGSRKVVLCVTTYMRDVESYVVHVTASDTFDEVLVLCSVTEKAHREHRFKSHEDGPFTFSECSKSLQLMALKEHSASAGASKGSLSTFVDVRYFAAHVCPIFGPSAGGVQGCFMLCADECKDVFPLTLSAYAPARSNDRNRFNLVSSGVDVVASTKSQSNDSIDGAKDVTNIWDADVSEISPQQRHALTRTAHEICGCLREMGLRVKDSNAFALGHSSELVGNKLMSLLTNDDDDEDDDGESSGAAHQRCSLLLIDRTLDMVAATQHGAHVIDDASRRRRNEGRGHPFLCHFADSAAMTLLRKLFTQGSTTADDEKDDGDESDVIAKTVARLERQLRRRETTGQTASASSSSSSSSSPSSSSIVERTMRLLDPKLETLKSARSRKEWIRRLDSLGIVESIVVPQMNEGSSSMSRKIQSADREMKLMERMQRELGCATEDILLQLADMLRRSSGVVTIKDILSLALHTFSLFGSKQLLHKRSTSMETFETALCDALLSARAENAVELESLGFVDAETIVALQRTKDGDVLSPAAQKKLRRRVSEVVARLFESGCVRTQFSESQFGSLQSERVSCGYRPLVQQIFDALLSPERPELENVKRVGSMMQQLTSGVTDLVGAAFSTFGWSAAPSKPRPTDLPVLVVFFVGGVTAFEISLVDAAMRKYNADARKVHEEPTYGHLKVIIGGTSISSASAVYSGMLANGYREA
eukprot:g263.t1